MVTKTLLIISCFLLPTIFCATAEETGNEIERILAEESSGNGNDHHHRHNNQTKFMEDLIEVQRTYRNLKAKWRRIMEEKSEVIRVARDHTLPPTTTTTMTTATTTTTTSTTPMTSPLPTSSESPDIQQIDIDVFEAADKFQDISDNEPSGFDDDAFIDISAQRPETTTVISELEQIQNAIRDAFHGKQVPEDVTTTTSTTTTTSPPPPPPPKSLLETFGSENVADPFEQAVIASTTTIGTTTSSIPTSTSIPLHILPQSTFISSGVANPDARPATSLFRYPSQVEIPFFGNGRNSEDSEGSEDVTEITIRRPTTPEPFASEEVEEEIDLDQNQNQNQNQKTTTTTSTSPPSTMMSTSTPLGIENNGDYVEETFSNEESEPEELAEPGTFGSPPGRSGPFFGSFGIGHAPNPPEPLPEPSGSLPEPIGPGSFAPGAFSQESAQAPGALAFGIGRSPPGSSSAPVASSPTPFPTLLVDPVVEHFFNDANDENDDDGGSSSSLGSFGSREVEVIANIPVDQHLEVLADDEVTTKPKTAGTKIAAINERAYRPPMFPSSMSSLTVRMPTPGNSYIQRTTLPPLSSHGLAEQQVHSVDMELPAWGAHKDHGIINKARREYQKEFEQQIRDVRTIDEQINKLTEINDESRSKPGQRCSSQVYAHTLTLPQIQQMSESLGLGDVAQVIRKASQTDRNEDVEISQLEVDLEEKRQLIAKIEILLSLAESRALLFSLLQEHKKIIERMENQALDMLQKTNFKPAPPSPFSAASDISELSTAVRQVLSAQKPKKGGRSMMKQKMKASAVRVQSPVGHLQETAEIVEPVLPTRKPLEQFGRERAPVAVAVHRRPLPLAPPTMNPLDFKFGPTARSLAHAAHPLNPARPIRPPTDEEVVMSQSETVHELIDMLHEDIVKLPEEEEERVCRQVQCDFEKADLCNLESSHDETTRLLKSKTTRTRRSTGSDDLLAEPSSIADDLLPYTFRAWSIWAGRRADRQKQIDIGPDFSPSNTHFAAVFLESQQAGILSMPLILSGTSTRIRLRVFEAARGMRLRVCCDRYCPLETELGLYRGHRKWLRKTVTCPPNTQTLSFECLNDGPDRGACGVDDIFVDSPGCRHFFDGADQS